MPCIRYGMKTKPLASLTLLVLLLPVSHAVAGEFSALINGRSYHIGADENWNENNYGLGVEYEFTSQSKWKKKLMANGFRDSNEEMSYMMGGGFHRTLYASNRLRGLYVDAGINAFVMTRQDVNDGKPFPGLLPSVTLGNRHVGVNVTYLPEKAVERLLDIKMSDDAVDGVVFLQLKLNLSGAD